MFSKLSSASLASLLLAIHVHGHALISPDLNGGTARADVTRPSANAPCGAGVDIASLINTAQAVPVTDGSVDATITNFNGGTDGSRFVTAQIDPTGTGNSFQDATVTTNGDKDPTDVGSQPLVVEVPASVKATGGTAGNRMLIAFKTLGGFGNCIAATTGDATAAASTNTTSTTTASDTAAAGDNTTAQSKTAAKGAGAAKDAGAAKGAGAGKAAAGAKAAGEKKKAAKGAKKNKKGKGKAAKGAAGTKAAKKAARHRDIQKLRLRNAIFDAMNN